VSTVDTVGDMDNTVGKPRQVLTLRRRRVPGDSPSACAVRLTDVRKEFGTGAEAVRALANVAAGTGPAQARS
jgi:hypothetical protein